MSDRARPSIRIAEAFEPFLRSSRFKAAYGGRGGGKSHVFAQLLLLRHLQARTRSVCIREVQNSIRDSVAQLLLDYIDALRLNDHFEYVDKTIRDKFGGLILFRGMQSFNAHTVKSLEGMDIAWCEEASALSHNSIDKLLPTIRKPGSELWFSWNPEFETDAVDLLFRGGAPPDDAIVVPVSWRDNPWLSKEALDEKDRAYRADPEKADHIWGGGYNIVSEASYFAREIKRAEDEGRVGAFPPIAGGAPIETAWDIGVDDYTAIWFVQPDEQRPRFVDYWECSGMGAPEIVAAALPELNPDQAERWNALAELGRRKPFRYGEHFQPHDVRVREWGGGARSRVEVLTRLGLKPLRVGAATKPEDRIAAARELLEVAVFDDTPRVRLGLRHLRRYARRWNQMLETYGAPLHDEHSHCADAFGEYAVNVSVRRPVKSPRRLRELPKGVPLPGAPKAEGRRRILL
ncbi:MAG: PBSX family phage terminase large subunit [Pseudomonadota bacterium]